MPDIKQKYGPAGQSITITLNSLGNSAVLPTSTGVRQSVYVDNSVDLFLDILLTVSVTLNAGSPANDKCLYVFVYGTVDGGTTYSGAASGTDSAYTLRSPSNLYPIGVINTPDLGGLTYSRIFSVASAFGGPGNLPSRWGIVIQNYSGLSLAASGNSVKYQGMYLGS